MDVSDITKRLDELDQASFTRLLDASEVAWLRIKLRTALELLAKVPEQSEEA